MTYSCGFEVHIESLSDVGIYYEEALNYGSNFSGKRTVRDVLENYGLFESTDNDTIVPSSLTCAQTQAQMQAQTQAQMQAQTQAQMQGREPTKDENRDKEKENNIRALTTTITEEDGRFLCYDTSLLNLRSANLQFEKRMIISTETSTGSL